MPLKPDLISQSASVSKSESCLSVGVPSPEGRERDRDSMSVHVWMHLVGTSDTNREYQWFRRRVSRVRIVLGAQVRTVSSCVACSCHNAYTVRCVLLYVPLGFGRGRHFYLLAP